MLQSIWAAVVMPLILALLKWFKWQCAPFTLPPVLCTRYFSVRLLIRQEVQVWPSLWLSFTSIRIPCGKPALWF